MVSLLSQLPPQSVPPLDNRGGDITLPPLLSIPYWRYLNSIGGSVDTIVKQIGSGTAETVIAEVALTLQTGVIPVTPILASGATLTSGIYRITCYAACTTAGAGTVIVQITATDVISRGQAFPVNLSLTSTANAISGVLAIKTDGSADVQYSTAIGGLVGIPKYSLYLLVEKMA